MSIKFMPVKPDYSLFDDEGKKIAQRFLFVFVAFLLMIDVFGIYYSVDHNSTVNQFVCSLRSSVTGWDFILSSKAQDYTLALCQENRMTSFGVTAIMFVFKFILAIVFPFLIFLFFIIRPSLMRSSVAQYLQGIGNKKDLLKRLHKQSKGCCLVLSIAAVLSCGMIVSIPAEFARVQIIFSKIYLGFFYHDLSAFLVCGCFASIFFTAYYCSFYFIREWRSEMKKK